jgi:hypothetical protein
MQKRKQNFAVFSKSAKKLFPYLRKDETILRGFFLSPEP